MQPACHLSFFFSGEKRWKRGRWSFHLFFSFSFFFSFSGGNEGGATRGKEGWEDGGEMRLNRCRYGGEEGFFFFFFLGTKLLWFPDSSFGQQMSSCLGLVFVNGGRFPFSRSISCCFGRFYFGEWLINGCNWIMWLYVALLLTSLWAQIESWWRRVTCKHLNPLL